MSLKSLAYLIIFSLLVTHGFSQTKMTSYSGNIKGYSQAVGYSRLELILNNAVTGLSETHIIEIKKNGDFSIAFPANFPQEYLVRFGSFFGHVYLEPGDNLVSNFYFDVNNKLVRKFSGDRALFNTQLVKTEAILLGNDHNKIYRDIADLNPEQYKAYYYQLERMQIIKLDSLKKSGEIGQKVYKHAARNLKYTTFCALIRYNSNRESAKRMMGQISFQDKKSVFEELPLDNKYFDFLAKIKYGDKASISHSEYFVFLGQLQTLDTIVVAAWRNVAPDLFNKIDIGKRLDSIELNTWNIIQGQIKNGIAQLDSYRRARSSVLKEITKNKLEFELELIALHDISQEISNKQVPLSADSLAKIKIKLRNKEFLVELEQLNNNIINRLDQNNLATKSNVNETPKTIADSVFNKIISKYKGKTVFVDFWATWCAPCIEGLQKMKSLKEELKERPVAFLYITNQTSSITAYNAMISGIKGEHYRITNDEYNWLAKKFNISGIPHYALVDRNGLVVDASYQWNDPEQIKLRLLELMK
ncbi:thiol-disulfide isomerase/thioredoxin [Pedobacter sp. UYP30]|uniref:TlpA family protein disulfide reductase n=1 Tax=Pedobacter sp. UYP30 TaxID=1756400 RepID=UPI003392ECB1